MDHLVEVRPKSRPSPQPSLPPLVIVSNRGPRDFVWKDGCWTPVAASGGLVSMLAPLAQREDVRWFCCVSEPPDAARAGSGLFTTAEDQSGGPLPVIPVPLPADIYHAYYGLISNEVLWMLQHRVVGVGGYEALEANRHRAWDEGYLAANARLAEAIGASCGPVRAFLLQDYHLYPLPALLRASFPTTPILHFTHIPFVVPPLMKLLPKTWREAILNGLLGADIVGMQTREDVEAFMRCCAEFLHAPLDDQTRAVQAQDGRWVRVRAYPASVHPREVEETMRSASVEVARQRIADQMGELNIIRVDRVDPSKNQLLGFRAFARLLELRPDLRQQVRFSAFLIPSRTDLSVYRSYTESIHTMIDEINARFATECGRPPISVFYANDREQALAAMELCDVLLVNSLYDGMNLVAKEWALVSKRPGVLVVSETAGVASEAEGSALLVSPLDVEGTARAMGEAIDMPLPERDRRLGLLKDRVSKWTAEHWLLAQLGDLGALPSEFETAGLAEGKG